MIRKSLFLLVLVGLFASFSLLASAYLTAQATVSDNAFVNGTVVLATSPTTALVTYNNLAPGDGTTAPLQVSNAGSLDLRYAMTTSVQAGMDQIILGGNFSQANGQTHLRVAQMNGDGSLDSSFTAGTDVTYYLQNNKIFALARQSDGKILVGGWFTLAAGQARQNFARFNANGTLDASFTNDTSNRVIGLAVQPDGKIVVGGGFGTLAGQSHPGIARLNADGSIDSTFTGFASGEVNALLIQPDGKLVLAGSFAYVDGLLRWNMARLNPDGSMDSGFNTAFYTGSIYALALQPNGQIVVGGSFPSYNFVAHPSLARLNSNGGIDSSFNASTNGTVNALIVQSDGKIVLGGSFSQVNGVPRNNLARLNMDGTLDSSFDPNVDGAVNALALQSDGQILAGGNFSQVGGQTHTNIARVSAVGNVDATFNAAADSAVNALVTAPGLASQLQLTIKAGVTTCTNSGYTAGGTILYSGALSNAWMGNPAQGSQPGDRALAPSSNERLCFHATLPLNAGNAFQNTTTTAAFTFSAEQTANNP